MCTLKGYPTHFCQSNLIDTLLGNENISFLCLKTNCLICQLLARNTQTGFTHVLFMKGLPATFNDDELLPFGQIKMVIEDNLMDRTSDDLLEAIAKIAFNTLKGNLLLSPQKIHVWKRHPHVGKAWETSRVCVWWSGGWGIKVKCSM